MRAGSKVIYAIAAFLGVLALIYILATTFVEDDANYGGSEWAGITALVLSFGLAMMLAVYLNITERRADVLPEDWEEAEVEDKAGILGFFSPGSIWPVVMSASILVLAYGIAFWHYWMIALGAALLIWACTMLNLQYGMPREKH
ncbi:cytochrome c oxidase subunit 4 [Corynebacterium halotolerans]|uniref:Cytochrome c oxidase polypeptide 4 n=1 Tax=Corynebacterium halotolerans YIM 70093 = DSM 44683 TaxID=1121362 RepID=M1NTX9_9CORY|nr:cytochrome c oxidase subunit 4 [Corynebacterium halotolerans]AGF72927.1 Cytochrome c oxidase polypeptide 4 [Corynebacterium halotolerans YIM 70093 = DSM 44683]